MGTESSTKAIFQSERVRENSPSVNPCSIFLKFIVAPRDRLTILRKSSHRRVGILPIKKRPDDAVIWTEEEMKKLRELITIDGPLKVGDRKSEQF